MADYQAIADAIAARYATIAGVQVATASPPNVLPATPAVVVWPIEGSVTFQGGRMLGEHDYRVALYHDRAAGDLATYMPALVGYIAPCLTALTGQAKLGLAEVAKALVTNWQMATLTYGGVEFVGLQITVRVWTEEQVALTP
jgi:hypothetical protein